MRRNIRRRKADIPRPASADLFAVLQPQPLFEAIPKAFLFVISDWFSTAANLLQNILEALLPGADG